MTLTGNALMKASRTRSDAEPFQRTEQQMQVLRTQFVLRLLDRLAMQHEIQAFALFVFGHA